VPLLRRYRRPPTSPRWVPVPLAFDGIGDLRHPLGGCLSRLLSTVSATTDLAPAAASPLRARHDRDIAHRPRPAAPATSAPTDFAGRRRSLRTPARGTSPPGCTARPPRGRTGRAG